MNKDEVTKKRVVDQLYWDARVDASNIKVGVDGDTVKLEGTVPDYTTSTHAVIDAYGVQGVSRVENNLSIEFPEGATIPSDEEIEKWINNSLFWYPSIDSQDIDVEVSKGFVTIEGSVDTYWKKMRAKNIASDTKGVLDVTNKLTIVPTKSFIDKDIAQDIENAIDRRHDVSPEDVDVRVENGTVTLTGEVPSWMAYSQIKMSAEHTLGVLDVVDNLRIDY